jgi:hypothetical protein
MADKKGPAMFMVMVDVPAEKEEEFNHWYNEEHLAELLAVPGVLNAARYEAIRSGPKHLAFYELENADVVRSEAFTSRPTTEWGKRIGPRVIGTNFSNNVYEMIYPAEMSSNIAQSDMAPALQIGRMAIPAEHEDEWNKWYSGVYVPNYEKVPGCIRGRRWRAVRGEPKYAVVYEFENQGISDSPEWAAQRDINPDNARMRSLMEHATSSPGIWKKTFQL